MLMLYIPLIIYGVIGIGEIIGLIMMIREWINER